MTENLHITNEIHSNGEVELAQIRQERWENAETRCRNMLWSKLHSLDRMENPNVVLSSRKIDFIPYSASLTPAECIALEGIGVDPKEFLPKLTQPQNKSKLLVRPANNITQKAEQKASIQIGDASMVIEQFHGDNNFSYRIKSENDDDAEALKGEILEKTKASFKAHPAYRHIHETVERHEISSDSATFHLNLDEDPQGLLVILNDIGALNWGGQQIQADILNAKFDIKTAVKGALERGAIKNGINSEDFVKVTFGNGVRSTLFLDKHTNDISVTFQTFPEDLYVEKPNQWQGVSEAFIDTICARELFELFARNGLALAQEYKNEMVRIGEAKRFGSVYTQLTREVAKWINRPSRTKVSNILAINSGFQDEFEAEEGEGEFVEEELRKRLEVINTDTVSEPTKVLIELMQNSVDREGFESDLRVTNSEVRVDSHACFDVTSYYLGGAAFGGVTKINVGAVSLLEKTHGGHTFMSLEPIVFNGVKIPKGTLLSQSEDDGGWFVQRLTPFTFDLPQDIAVFGSEIVKSKDIEKDSIQLLGGIGLNQIVRNVT